MIVVYSKPYCPYCEATKRYLKDNNIPFREIDVSQDPKARAFLKEQGHRTVPQIYKEDGTLLVAGGNAGLQALTPDEIRARAGIASNAS